MTNSWWDIFILVPWTRQKTKVCTTWVQQEDKVSLVFIVVPCSTEQSYLCVISLGIGFKAITELNLMAPFIFKMAACFFFVVLFWFLPRVERFREGTCSPYSSSDWLSNSPTLISNFEQSNKQRWRQTAQRGIITDWAHHWNKRLDPITTTCFPSFVPKSCSEEVYCS